MRQKLLTIQEASEFLGVSSKTLRRWEERGLLIPLRTTGNQRRFSLNQLRDFRKLGKKNTSLKVSHITSEPPSPLTLASMISTNPQPQKSFEKGGVDEAKKPHASEQKKWFETLYEILEIKNIRSTIYVSHIQKSLLFGAVGVLVLVFLGVLTTKVVLPTSSGLLSFVFQNPNQKFSEEGLSGDDLKAVLGVADAETLFNFNIPVLFKDEVEIEKNLAVVGTATVSGNLTAPNVLYALTAGNGIGITTGQRPTISNSGVLSLNDKTGALSLTAGTGISLDGLKISSTVSSAKSNSFETMKLGSSTVTASSSTDTFTFAAGTNISLALDTSNKKLTITGSSSGTIGGSGTAGTLAKFSDASTLADSLISESSTTISLGTTTALTGGSLTSMTTSSTFTFAAAATTLNIGPTGSGASSLLLSGGSSDTGCTIDGSTGALTCAGAISSSATSGTQGYWNRSGTTLTPATATDTINTSGNITFSGTINTNTFSSTALTFAGTDPVISGPTGGSNTISLNSGASGSVLLAGGSGSTGCTIADATGNLTCTGSISSSGGSDTGFWSRNSGTSTISPVTTGDHVSTTGNISTTGSGTITSAGLITGQAGITITGGTTSLNASSNFATNINTGTSTGAIGIGNSAAGAITIASGASSTFTVTNGNISLITTGASGANGVINLTSALASGNTTTAAFNITTSTDLAGTDEVLQIGDSAGTFLTVRGDGGVGIGDISPDGLLDLDTAATSGTIFGITSTGIQTSGDIVNITANSLTTADIIDISTTGLTTGSAIRITGPSSTGITTGTTAGLVTLSSDVGSAGTAGALLYLTSDFSAGSATTSYGIYNNATDDTGIGNTNYGYYGTFAQTGNAAKTAYGMYQNLTTTSTVGSTMYGVDINVDSNAAISSGTKSLYGIRSIVFNNGFTDSGTSSSNNVYAGYFQAISNPGSYAYGVYIAGPTSGDENFPLYIDYNNFGTVGFTIESAGSTITAAAGPMVEVDMAGNITSTNTSPTGVNIIMDLATNTSGTNTMTGLLIDSGAISHSTTGSTTQHMINLSTANITQNTGTTVTANGTNVTLGTITTQGTQNGLKVTNGSITTAGTQNGVNITLGAVTTAGTHNGVLISPPSTTSTGGTYNAINIGAITTSNGTDTAISIGDVWDDAINVNSGQFIVETTGVASVGLDNTETTNGLCHSGADVDAASNTTVDIVACSAAPGDIAEWYETTGAIEEGEIVSTSNELFTYQETQTNPMTGEILPNKIPRTINKLEISQQPYQNNIIGIVSTSPYQVFGADIKKQGSAPKPIALTGRAPVKVSTENGDIQKGDYLTSSSTPGVAMKATRPGPVVGKALEEFNPNASECLLQINPNNTNDSSEGFGSIRTNNSDQFVCQGKIMIYVNVSFADPNSVLANLSFDANGNLIQNTQNTQGINTSASQSLGISDLLTSPISSDSAELSESSESFDLSKDPLFTGLQQTVTDLQQKIDLLESQLISNATSSASLLSSIASASATLSTSSSAVLSSTTTYSLQPTPSSSSSASLTSFADLDVQAATVSGNLIVSGRTLLNDLGVTGKIQSGLLTIDGLNNEINTLAGDLKLQSNKLAGIDILNGTVTIDTNGNITTLGTIKAKELQTEKLTITTQSASNSGALSASAGVVTIPVGQTSIDVDTTALTDNSLIFVTAEEPIPVGSKKKDNDTFTISVQTPPVSDLKVNWWIVDRR